MSDDKKGIVISAKDAMSNFAKNGLQFSSGLQLPLTPEGQYNVLVLVDDAESLVIESAPIDFKGDIGIKQVYSLLGTVTLHDGQEVDMSEAIEGTNGMRGGLSCTSPMVMENLKAGQTLHFVVKRSKKGNNFAEFVPSEIAIGETSTEQIDDEEGILSMTFKELEAYAKAKKISLTGSNTKPKALEVISDAIYGVNSEELVSLEATI